MRYISLVITKRKNKTVLTNLDRSVCYTNVELCNLPVEDGKRKSEIVPSLYYSKF